jgi:hypothetical protein
MIEVNYSNDTTVMLNYVLAKNDYEGTLYLNPYTCTSSTYNLVDVTLNDVNGNSNTYYPPDSSQTNTISSNLDISVQNTINVAFTASANDSNLINRIEQSPDDAIIFIYADGIMAPKQAFDAIKGTDKTLVFSCYNMEWIFNGKDIVNPTKDLNLILTVTPLGLANTLNIPVGTSISIAGTMIDGKPAAQLNFADNGLLPGKCLIRVPNINSLMAVFGTNDLYLYYYDQTANDLQMVDDNVSMSPDGYYEFYINHNSVYVMAQANVRVNSIAPQSVASSSAVSSSSAPSSSTLVSASSAINSANISQTTTDSSTVTAPSKSSKSNVVMIVSVIILFLILAGVGVYFIIKKRKNL